MTAAAREQTRARYPDDAGDLDRDGVRVHWERYGDGERSILFLPTWSIVHSRCWKAQIPYLARRHRVIVFDPRGNGLLRPAARSGRLRRGGVGRRRAGGARRGRRPAAPSPWGCRSAPSAG